MVKLFVGNLPPSASNQSLKEIFQQYKDLQDYKLISNYGFVYLESEESAIHAVNNLNGLEYRGFPIAIDFARDQNKLKRKSDSMLDNQIEESTIPHSNNINGLESRGYSNSNEFVRDKKMKRKSDVSLDNRGFKSFIQQPTQNFCPPIAQQRNMNPYNLPLLNTPNFNPRNGFNDDYDAGSNQRYRQNNFNNYPVKSVQGHGKKFSAEYFTEDDFYDFNSNNNIYDMKYQPDMYQSAPTFGRPSWYERTQKKGKNQYFIERERHKYNMPRRELKRPTKKFYIDEYEDKADPSTSDSYPAYLKQYHK